MCTFHSFLTTQAPFLKNHRRNNLLSILLNTTSCQLEDVYTWHKKAHYHSTGSTGLLEWTVTKLELRFWPMLKKTMLSENMPRNNEPGEVWQTFCRTMRKYVCWSSEAWDAAFPSTIHLSKMSSTHVNTYAHTILTGTTRSWSSLNDTIHFWKFITSTTSLTQASINYHAHWLIKSYKL